MHRTDPNRHGRLLRDRRRDEGQTFRLLVERGPRLVQADTDELPLTKANRLRSALHPSPDGSRGPLSRRHPPRHRIHPLLSGAF
ncbi:hypothetical protein FAIPA1_310015 [Frankia sp. AiPs1]